MSSAHKATTEIWVILSLRSDAQIQTSLNLCGQSWEQKLFYSSDENFLLRQAGHTKEITFATYLCHFPATCHLVWPGL